MTQLSLKLTTPIGWPLLLLTNMHQVPRMPALSVEPKGPNCKALQWAREAGQPTKLETPNIVQCLHDHAHSIVKEPIDIEAPRPTMDSCPDGVVLAIQNLTRTMCEFYAFQPFIIEVPVNYCNKSEFGSANPKLMS